MRRRGLFGLLGALPFVHQAGAVRASVRPAAASIGTMVPGCGETLAPLAAPGRGYELAQSISCPGADLTPEGLRSQIERTLARAAQTSPKPWSGPPPAGWDDLTNRR